jgi:hypothetical protein
MVNRERNLMHYIPDTRLEGLIKITKNLSQNNHTPLTFEPGTSQTSQSYNHCASTLNLLFLFERSQICYT